MPIVRNFDDNVRLAEITPRQVAAARRVIATAAIDADDHALILDAIHPQPHTITRGPSKARALPRRGASA